MYSSGLQDLGTDYHALCSSFSTINTYKYIHVNFLHTPNLSTLKDMGDCTM